MIARSTRSRRVTRPLVTLAVALSAVIAATLAPPSTALATPSVWARARNPELARRHSALAEVEALLIRYEREQSPSRGEQLRGMSTAYLLEAKSILEGAGGEKSRDPMIRYRLAQVLYDLRQYPRATKVYESVARGSDLAAPFRASALSALGTCYAHVGRRDDEIKAYTEALALTTYGAARANILANRAEAYMAMGNLTAAIQGYRDALASLSSLHPVEMIYYGVTPLWGLAVALDRSGDLEGGIRSIKLAREYDPSDRQINRPNWFYAPPHDEAWYAALGHWTRARNVTLKAARAEAYASAVEAWERFIDKAPSDDAWIPLARARLRACEKERDAVLKRDVPSGKAQPANKAKP
jgi:tetratricopeptide (TPR) repeat protein